MDALKVCIECGELGSGTRCDACQAELDQRLGRQRGGANARGYTRQWQGQSARVRREQPYCDECGTPVDLTCDHVVAKANGGTDDRSNLTTLCRRHNGAKGRR